MHFCEIFAGVFSVTVLIVTSEASPYGYYKPSPRQAKYAQTYFHQSGHQNGYEKRYEKQTVQQGGYHRHQQNPHHPVHQPTYHYPTPITPTPTTSLPLPPTMLAPSFPSHVIINSNINTNSNNNTDIAAAAAYLLSQLISFQTANQNQSQISFPYFTGLAPADLIATLARQGEPAGTDNELATLFRQGQQRLNTSTAALPTRGIINLNSNSNSNLNELFSSLFISIFQLLSSFQSGSQSQTQT